jgi:hypothetical protein
MIDRYTKFILTVIAGALLYLAVILTPLPRVSAQGRAGELSGPLQVVVVGSQMPAGQTMPVSFQQPVPVTLNDPVTVTGRVTTERSSGAADRVVLVGWEENSNRDKASQLQQFSGNVAYKGRALPVQQLPK